MKENSYVIGITGHRDLNKDTFEQVSANISRFLDEIKLLLPNTPIKIISGMADGADRILVKEALKKNIAVNILQPMPDSLYQTDFSEGSWQEYKTIIANTNVKINILPCDNVNIENAKKQGQERDSLYHALGQCIVEQSNLMISVWDGVNSGLKGGTADVVLSYLQGKEIFDDISKESVTFVADSVSINESSSTVYWLPVSQEKTNYHQINESSAKPCFLTGRLGPYALKKQDDMPKHLLRELIELNGYNKQFHELTYKSNISTDYSLLTSYKNSGNEQKEALLKKVDDEFLKADAIALFNQKKSDGQFKLFAYMAGLMGLFFLIYAKIIASKFLLIGYLLLFVLGWLFFKSANKSEWFTRHLTARVLAETLRTQFYLTLIDKQQTSKVTKLMDDMGITQFKGTSWIKQTVTALFSNQKEEQNEYSVKQKEENVAFACQHWLADQAKYFNDKTKRLSSHHHKLEKIKGILFIGSAIATISLILFKYQLVDIVLFAHVDAKTFTVLLMGLLPFWLAVWELYQNKMAIKELLWQYRNQSIVFNQAQKEIANAITLEQKSEILIRLAHRSTMENYIWIIHRYHREHEPPTAG
jgi:hypothetical protein